MDPALLLAAGIVLVACGVAWQVPSQAHWALLVVGFAMDPIRKVVPGQPVWLTGVVAGVLLLTYLRQQQGDVRRSRPDLFQRMPELAGPVQLGGIWVLFQALRGYEATGSAAVAGIGCLSYLAPVLAVATGYALASSAAQVRRILLAYVGCIIVACLTVLMSFWGTKWEIFKQVGAGLVIYGGETGVIRLHTGFFRGPELAGWHMGLGFCALLLLACTARTKAVSLLAVPGMGLLVLGMFVTGRRKYLLAVMVFVVTWLMLAWAYRRRRTLALLATLSAGFAAVGVVAVDVVLSRPGGAVLEVHAQRIGLGGEQAQGRFFGMTLGALPAAIEENGWLGAGAGVGSQGSQHFKTDGRGVGWAGEGGLGKVVSELGLPGLAVAIWLLILVSRRILRGARDCAWVGGPIPDVMCGLIGVLLSCVVTFSIGHQVYGDPFVLSVVGILIGFALRLPMHVKEPTSANAAPTRAGMAVLGPARSGALS